MPSSIFLTVCNISYVVDNLRAGKTRSPDAIVRDIAVITWEKKMIGKIMRSLSKQITNITLINFFTIERALHEINYEILFRPAKIIVPILGLKELIDQY